jgi:hypothetical protein
MNDDVNHDDVCKFVTQVHRNNDDISITIYRPIDRMFTIPKSILVNSTNWTPIMNSIAQPGWTADDAWIEMAEDNLPVFILKNTKLYYVQLDNNEFALIDHETRTHYNPGQNRQLVQALVASIMKRSGRLESYQ